MPFAYHIAILIACFVLWATTTIIVFVKRSEGGFLISFCMFALLTMYSWLIFIEYPQCPSCGCRPNSPDSAFCEECGSKITLLVNCPECEKQFGMENISKSCPDCETKTNQSNQLKNKERNFLSPYFPMISFIYKRQRKAESKIGLFDFSYYQTNKFVVHANLS